MSKTNLTRHEIRESALQALFPLDFNDTLTKQDAIFHALALNHQELVSGEGDEFVPEYLDQLVGGVCDHKAEIDQLIEQNLGSNWSIKRIAKIDLIVLRLGIFEIMYVEEVPDTVVVNEAIELAKKYSDDRSRKFVNGVLANIVKTKAEA